MAIVILCVWPIWSWLNFSSYYVVGGVLFNACLLGLGYKSRHVWGGFIDCLEDNTANCAHHFRHRATQALGFLSTLM